MLGHYRVVYWPQKQRGLAALLVTDDVPSKKMMGFSPGSKEPGLGVGAIRETPLLFPVPELGEGAFLRSPCSRGQTPADCGVLG